MARDNTCNQEEILKLHNNGYDELEIVKAVDSSLFRVRFVIWKANFQFKNPLGIK